ncbi:hypothetical protein DFH09DRAFT_1364688 [Mycena vulgaris]|nr:hypothetical protein DFH09DRAFT_1364688 [Mycena vulgaris]
MASSTPVISPDCRKSPAIQPQDLSCVDEFHWRYDDLNQSAVLPEGEIHGAHRAGLARRRTQSTHFEPGVAFCARATLLAEGAHGPLSKSASAICNLRARSEAQAHVPGKVVHTIGRPLSWDMYGGGWEYHMADGLVSVGLVGAVSRVSVHETPPPLPHAACRAGHGGRTLTEGGLQSVPQLHFPRRRERWRGPHRTLCAAWLSRATPLHIYTTRPAPAALAPLQIWPTIGDVGVHSPHHFEPAFDRLRRQVGLARRFYRPPHLPPSCAALALPRTWATAGDVGVHTTLSFKHPFDPVRPLDHPPRCLYRTPPPAPLPPRLRSSRSGRPQGTSGCIHPIILSPPLTAFAAWLASPGHFTAPPASRPLASRWRLPGSGRQHGTSGCIPPFLSSLPSPPHAPGSLALAPLPHPPLPGPPPPR